MASSGLTEVTGRAHAAARRAGREPDDITIVAVSKTVGPKEILAAYESGHRHFGENRSHELVEKAAVLPDDIVWHFVGTLQSRKARDVAPIAAVVHSVDRVSLLKEFAKHPNQSRLLIQVNLAHEAQKHGVDPVDVEPLLRSAAELGVSISGLMLMPPLVVTAEENRHWFSQLATLQRKLRVAWPGLAELSMGMTDDFEVAIEEGATLIRVGRAIFGS
ncbi:MAG: YggS family pyridoxal phosphate-dependent enzyme [Acidimicrobiia bacterium]|nr:YggS family pyridoxal phosphate-dependent enzyme [Acidimicrobiia bacterium]